MTFKSNAAVFNAPRERVWQALEQICRNLKWTISHSKPEQGIMEVKSGASFLCPLGILLTIRVTAVDPNKTQIHAEAKSRGQLVDYGKSSGEIKRLFEALAKMVVSMQEAPSNNMDGISCSKCGCSLDAGAKFCRKCGEPIAIVPAAKQNSCISCGKELDSNMKFCPGCGQSIAQ